MPAIQRGSVRTLPSGKKQLRYYDNDGQRQSGGVFATRSEAWKHYREVIEPQLSGLPAALPDLTLSEFVELYLDRHSVVVRGRTIRALRERLGYATRAYGDVQLSALEPMSGELADWRKTLPERSRYAIMSALRQALAAAVRWHYIDENPAKQAGKNPQPPPRPVRPYTLAELDAIAAELSLDYEPLPDFAAATGLRPEEWMVGAQACRPALERRQRAADRLRGRDRRASQDRPQSPPGAALTPSERRARPFARPDRPAAVRRSGGRAA
jgi:hypothetical protein